MNKEYGRQKEEAKKPKTDSSYSYTTATGDDLKKKEAVKEKASLQNHSGNNTRRTNQVPDRDGKKHTSMQAMLA